MAETSRAKPRASGAIIADRLGKSRVVGEKVGPGARMPRAREAKDDPIGAKFGAPGSKPGRFVESAESLDEKPVTPMTFPAASSGMCERRWVMSSPGPSSGGERRVCCGARRIITAAAPSSSHPGDDATERRLAISRRRREGLVVQPDRAAT